MIHAVESFSEVLELALKGEEMKEEENVLPAAAGSVQEAKI
jgi:ATP-dependent Lon protease